MARVTSRQLMGKLGIENIKTLTRWHHLGLIPPPEVEPHPDGAGRIGTWPHWVLEHGREIRRLQEQGQTLEEIAATFGQDWEAIAWRYPGRRKRGLSLKPVGDELLVRDVLTAMERELHRALDQTQGKLTAAAIGPIGPELAQQSLDLYRDGYCPVLFVAGPHRRIVPDFLLPHLVTSASADGLLCITLVVQHVVAAAADAQGVTPSRRIRPAKKVVVRRGRKREEMDFDIAGDGQVVLRRD